MTPGSWWRHPRTGQRLIVPKHPTLYMAQRRWGRGHWLAATGPGQPLGRLPALQEGERLNLAWLLPDELAGAWRLYRPVSKNAVAPPPWVTNPIGDLNDFLLDGSLHVAVLGIRGRVIALTGMDPEPEKWDGWAKCSYTTLFIETHEARTRLTPKYAKLRPTAWDRVTAE